VRDAGVAGGAHVPALYPRPSDKAARVRRQRGQAHDPQDVLVTPFETPYLHPVMVAGRRPATARTSASRRRGR
jgi:hypothetical protein